MRPIRVLIDARMCDGRPSGVSRYVTRIIRELRRDDAITPVALCGKEVSDELVAYGVELCPTDFDRPVRPIHRRSCWERDRLASIIAHAGVDLYHATWNTGIPRRCPVPAVLTIHDLIPLWDLAEYFPSRLHRWSYAVSLHTSVRRAAHIVTVSNSVRNDCIRRLHIAADRITAIHNGVDAGGSASDPDLVRRDYCLYVGGAERRKNIAAVFQAMDRLWRGGKGVRDLLPESPEVCCVQKVPDTFSTPGLWLTGTLDGQCPAARTAYASLKHPDRVTFLGMPDDRRLGVLMASARALLMLSTAEGFGLPAAEAMAHGCPVVVSDRASLPEVVGDAGLIVDPDDPDAVARAVLRVARDETLRTELIGRGLDRVTTLSWTQAARQTAAIYQAAVTDCGTKRRGRIGQLLDELGRSRRLYQRAGPDGIAEAY